MSITHLENTGYADTWKDVKVLLMTYSNMKPLDPLEFVRTIAVARIIMPQAKVRMSAGRAELGEAIQALCFLAGANSIFYGEKLLTTDNADAAEDRALLAKLGLKPFEATDVKARMPGLPEHDHHDH